MNREAERKRLVELLQGAYDKYINLLEFEKNIIAKHLIENGVIVPTIKLNDIIYRCGEENVHEWQIVRIDVYPDEIVYIDDSDNEIFENDIGKTVFLTREQAEKALEGKGE